MNQEIKTINLKMVNCYLINTGDGFVLIDTGFPVNRELLELELEKAGCRPGNLNLIIITHGDWDHSGNCDYLRSKYHSKIAMHAGDSEKCRTDSMIDNRKIRSFLFRIISRLMYIFLIGPKLKQFPFEPFVPDILLSDGEDMSGFGLNAKVIHLPGHSNGSIGILTDDGSLISGDIIMLMGKPGITLIVENEAELLSSIEKIKALPAKKVYPGHGMSFSMADFIQAVSKKN